jgi:plastocyanin
MRALAMLLLLASPALAAQVDGRVVREGDGVAYVAVVLDGGEARRAPREAHVDEVQLSFVPKVQVVAPGSRLVFHDRDDEAHGVHGWWSERTLFNRAVVPGEPGFAVVLDQPGVLALTCDLHQSMRAFVVVSDSPLATVTSADGRFHLDDVPLGSYVLRALYPEPGHAMGSVVQSVEISGGTAVLAVNLPPRAASAATTAAPPAHADPPRRSAAFTSWMRSINGWPHSRWAVNLLIVAGLFTGFGLAAAILSWGARRRRTIEALFVGCAVAFAAGALVVVGLNGAVATALGFGIFTGSFLFGAWRWQARAS